MSEEPENKNESIFQKRVSTYFALSIVIPLLIGCAYIVDICNWRNALVFGHDSTSYAMLAEGTDNARYIINAKGILKREWPVSPFYRAPLISFLLALELSMCDSILFIACCQLLLVVATVFLTYQIGKLMFDEISGFIAAVMLSLYGGFVFLTVVPLSTVTEAFFATLSLFLICRLRRNFCIWMAIVTGLSGALIVLTRPNYLAIFPVAFALVALEYCLTHKSFKRSVPVLVAGAAAFLILVSPAIIWNNVSSEKGVIFVPSTNGAHTYRISNSYDSPVFNYREPHERQMPTTTWPFWRHQFHKAWGYWRAVDYPQNVNFYFYRQNSSILKLLFVNFGLIGVLYLCACIWFIRDWRDYWPFYLYPMGLAITVIAFYIIGRFRIPAVPGMAVFGAAFVMDFYRKLRTKAPENYSSRQKIRLYIFLVLFLVLFFLSRPFESVIRKQDWQKDSTTYLAQLDIPGYREALTKLLAEYPDDHVAWLYLIAANIYTGNVPQAEKFLVFFINRDSNNNEAAARRGYFILTLRDLNLARKIQEGKTSRKAWLDHIKDPSRCGHLARFYLELEKISRKRFRLGIDHSVNNVADSILQKPQP